MKPLDTCSILQPIFALLSKENVKYAVRLRNYGSRTANGDGGMTTVQCPDGVTFTFSTCSLSSNGTNQTRGQIPQILYYRFVSCNDSVLSERNHRSAIIPRLCLRGDRNKCILSVFVTPPPVLFWFSGFLT